MVLDKAWRSRVATQGRAARGVAGGIGLLVRRVWNAGVLGSVANARETKETIWIRWEYSHIHAEII